MDHPPLLLPINWQGISNVFIHCVEKLLLGKPDNPIQFIIDHLSNTYPESVMRGAPVSYIYYDNIIGSNNKNRPHTDPLLSISISTLQHILYLDSLLFVFPHQIKYLSYDSFISFVIFLSQHTTQK